jgi:hypothetical protein
MIRGAEQAFKFTTSFDFKDICNIVAVWSQPHNEGTTLAPMPIEKYYNRQITNIDEWGDADKDEKKTYCVGTKYYRYDSSTGEFVASNTKPTESDISGGEVTTWPLSDDCEISKVYKCDKSYYQYDPSTQKWNITQGAPSIELQSLDKVGVTNIPSSADKKRACVYNQRYYRYVGGVKGWETSTDEILPIEEIGYWDSSKENDLDTNKTYCALETYYKYADGSWKSYGRPAEVRVLNSDCDKSSVYMMKELYYQYNVVTDQFEKTGVREVYYQYNTTKERWEECECPCIDAEEIDLWVDTDEHDANKTYVCKNVYYRYNAGLGTPAWEASNNMLIPVIEIDEWVEDGTVYYDTSKIYMCRARYYQYNIEDEEWVEVEKVVHPRIINLDYWTEQTDLRAIYCCGPTYFQYDSSSADWISSTSANMQVIRIDYPSEATDQSKIYECSPIYYAYKGDTWEAYKSMADAARNDCFAPVDGDPKSFIAMLSAEETMRFHEKYKGRVQATVYCDTVNRTDKSKVEYFTVYPTMTEEVFSNIAPGDKEIVRILDAGEIMKQ